MQNKVRVVRFFEWLFIIWPSPSEQMPFEEISRVLKEEGDRPMTLRFERYPQVRGACTHTCCERDDVSLQDLSSGNFFLNNKRRVKMA